ncbi:hypothetical protein KKF82_07540 [Patescibacteria group bacterium]|nr:hypothetical protein [Patescibacteria group bacterium]
MKDLSENTRESPVRAEYNYDKLIELKEFPFIVNKDGISCLSKSIIKYSNISEKNIFKISKAYNVPIFSVRYEIEKIDTTVLMLNYNGLWFIAHKIN